MAPGIVTPPGGLDSTIQKQKAVMICVAGIRHPVAIGIAEASANDLALRKSGKAVKERIRNSELRSHIIHNIYKNCYRSLLRLYQL